MTTTPNTTASGAANAGLHALADRIEEAQGRAICISVESADYLREALAASAAVAPAPAPASGELVAEVMFDERKYIQYTIPLELLPVGAKFYTAQEARVPLSDEQIFKAYTTATGEKLLKQGPARPGLLQIFRLAEAAHGIKGKEVGNAE